MFISQNEVWSITENVVILALYKYPSAIIIKVNYFFNSLIIIT